MEPGTVGRDPRAEKALGAVAFFTVFFAVIVVRIPADPWY